MSDRAQFNMERMVPEFEEYLNLNIYTSEELKKIIENRRLHESRIHRKIKKPSDFKSYLKHEFKLQKMTNNRLKKNNISLKKNFQNKIIFEIYRHFLHHFPETETFKEFLNFSIENKFPIEKIVTEMCMKEPRNIENWIYATNMLYKTDIHTTRILLQRAIRINPKEPQLKIIFLKIELNFLKLHSDEIEYGEDDYKVPLVVYKEYIKSNSTPIALPEIEDHPIFKKMIENLGN